MKSKKQREPQAPVRINGRRTRNYICLVDANRPPHMVRRTAGRYRVGAKSEKEAVRLLQKTIGFGSVCLYYEDGTADLSDVVPYGTCMRETWDPTTRRYAHEPAIHIGEPVRDMP